MNIKKCIFNIKQKCINCYYCNKENKNKEYFWTGQSGLSQKKRDDVFFSFMRDVKLPLKIGLLYNLFIKRKNYGFSYRTFRRLILEYQERGFLHTIKQTGVGGNTTIIKDFLQIK